jgi:hypothetical protein
VQSNLADDNLATGKEPLEGRVLMQNVSRGLTGIAPGTVKTLRVVAVPPKVQPHMNNPSLGISNEDPGKFVLGTVPVEADGSANFRLPSGVPVFFQALDASGVAVQTMRTLTYVVPGQTLACVGCHDGREASPPVGQLVLAATREPSKITPGPDGSWPLRFDKLVQPVLDHLCVECHRPDAKDAQAAKLDLTPARAYDSLLGFGGGDLKKTPLSATARCLARAPQRKANCGNCSVNPSLTPALNSMPTAPTGF